MKPPWNFSTSRNSNISLDEFLAKKEAVGFAFFAGKERWMNGISKVSTQTFYRICTEEMDDLSETAVKLVIEYCLQILEESERQIKGKPTLGRLDAVLESQYENKLENRVHQFRWALMHPVVKEAINTALGNRFPSR